MICIVFSQRLSHYVFWLVLLLFMHQWIELIFNERRGSFNAGLVYLNVSLLPASKKIPKECKITPKLQTVAIQRTMHVGTQLPYRSK